MLQIHITHTVHTVYTHYTYTPTLSILPPPTHLTPSHTHTHTNTHTQSTLNLHAQLAKHCGYRPHEVNASDDRSAATLRDTMIQAMHGNTLSGNKAPNCIILDEIDGSYNYTQKHITPLNILCILSIKKSSLYIHTIYTYNILHALCSVL